MSQFISPFTGLVYDKHITGLCNEQQEILKMEIRKSRANGYMPKYHRKPQYKNDPKLFDALRPKRANPL